MRVCRFLEFLSLDRESNRRYFGKAFVTMVL